MKPVDKIDAQRSKLEMGQRAVFIPRDLALPLPGLFDACSPGLRRQLVAACVFGGGGSDGEWVTREAVRRGHHVWPELARERMSRVTVLSALLELELLGVVSDVRQQGTGFWVKEVAA